MAFFGNHNPFNSSAGSLQGNEWGLYITINTPFTVTHLGLYTDAGNTTGTHVIMAFYDASGTGGHPNNLLAQTNVFTISASANNQETKVALVTPYSGSAGGYWICMLTDDGTMTVGYPSSTPGRTTRNTATYPTLMSPWTQAGTVDSTWNFSFFAEGTEGTNPSSGGQGPGRGPGKGPGRGGSGARTIVDGGYLRDISGRVIGPWRSISQ